MTTFSPDRPRRRAARRPAGRPAALILALGLAGVAANACSGAGPTAPDPCGGPLTLAIGGGPRPTLGWAPACPVYLVAVTDTAGRVVWQRIGAGNDIAPPVRYPDAEPDPANGDAAPLAPGRRYGVRLWRTVPRPTPCLDFLTVCGVSVVADSEFVR
jgi:hypothetical protein